MNDPGDLGQAEFDKEREKAWLAIVLAWVAGFVDALGYLSLIHIFTSHMSGNSVVAATSLTERNWSEAVLRGVPILFFILGVILGTLVEITAQRKSIRRRFSLAMLLEVALLVVLMLYGCRLTNGPAKGVESQFDIGLLTALLSTSMGVQSSTLRRVRGQAIHTAFITGMLSQFADNAAGLFLRMLDRLRRRASSEARIRSNVYLSRMRFYGSLWLAFVLGAISGCLGHRAWDFLALTVPLCVLGFVIFCDLFRPIHD